MVDLKPCSCGCVPEIEETWDTLKIFCPNCGKTTPVFFGDYYDEAFMLATYGKQAAEEWNRLVGEENDDAIGDRKMYL